MEERTGSGGVVIFREDAKVPEQISFEVTNPSTTHDMLGFGFVFFNFNYRAEYHQTWPAVRLDGMNNPNHDLAYQPLPIHAVNGVPGVFLNEGPRFTETIGGMSVVSAIGPDGGTATGGVIEPGGTWSDTINFSVLGLEEFPFSVRVEDFVPAIPADNTTDPPTEEVPAIPAVFEDQMFRPNLEVLDWSIRVVGMLV